MDNYNLTNITIDSSGNKYLKTVKEESIKESKDGSKEESNIIDTFDNKNKNCCEDNHINALVNNEKLLIENKKLKDEIDKINKEVLPITNKKFNEMQIQNQELLYENSLLRKRLMQVDYNTEYSDQISKDNIKKTTEGTESSTIDDDDHLISSSKKDTDVTSYEPFKLFSKLIIQFSEIKNILKKFTNGSKEYQHNINIEEQESDDLLFYKSIILDSKKFYITSHKIRKNKLVYDINQILKMFNYPNMPSINEVNKTTKGILKKYYHKLAQEVKDNNDSVHKPIWIKNNKHKYIETIKREMNRTFLYHIEINTHYLENLIKELNFFKIQ